MLESVIELLKLIPLCSINNFVLFWCTQVALELIKVVGGYEFESFKNCFFNLAIPVVVLTEPAPVKRTLIR